ncbi:MAG: hypothetical protein HY810_09935, partial [Candidatus Omnitrophica bacterium]|nr:hypothetical protein [Candidatus Omnitrophota bacterium]
MSELTNKLWFKLVALIVLEAFFLTIADISWAGNYRENRGSQQMAMDSQKQKDERDKLSKDALNNQIVMTQPAMPYMGFGQITPKNGAQDISLIDTTINGLSIAGNDLPEIFRVLKNSGCAVSEAGFAAVRQGFDKKEIYHAMIKAGYDKEEVKTLLGSLLKAEEEKKQREEAQQEEKTGPPELGEATEEEKAAAEAILSKEKEAAVFEIPKVTDMPVEKEPSKVVERTIREDALLRQTVEFVRLMINEGKRGSELVNFLKKSGLTEERIVSALAQLGFSLKDIVDIFRQANISCSEIVQALQNALVNYSEKEIYNALLKCGFSDAEIIKAFKGAGMNAEDILKLTTELGRNMIEVAKAMISAGFSNGQIARAYVLKAMKWTWDQTVNMINCAVKAFDAFLTNIGRKFSSKEDLANALIIDDILATGEVQIQNKDVMTSMAAIRNVAKQYGVDLEGYKLTLESLLELSGMAIVHIDGDHWVSLVSIDGESVTIIDNGEKKTISLNEFKIRWDGNALAINQQEIKEDKLNDLQMREIRGGRGGILGFFEKVVKGIVNSIKTLVTGLYNAIKGSLQMAIGLMTFNWDMVKQGFWTSTMGTMQILCAPTVALYSILPENVARIVGQVMKVICVAVCTIIGGIIGTICGGQTQLGMAIGAFVGTIIGYCFDYDMVMACQNSDMESFKVQFKRMIIEAVINAVVAFCMSYAGGASSIQSGVGGATTVGQGITNYAASAAGSGIAGAAAGSTTASTLTTTATATAAAQVATNITVSQALTVIIVNAAVSAIKQTLVAYVITYCLNAAGVTNPYLRAVILGAAGAWAGSGAGTISATSGGGYEFAKVMSQEIVKEMVVGALTQVTVEAIKQAGYKAGWDPLVVECVSLAAGTIVNAGAGAAMGLNYSVGQGKEGYNNSMGSNFGTLFMNNLSSALGGLAGSIASSVVVRIGKENGWDPILISTLSAIAKDLAGSMVGAAVSDKKSFTWGDVGMAMMSGLNAAAIGGYENLLIREFGYSEADAKEAVYITSMVYNLASTGPRPDGSNGITLDQIINSGLGSVGFNSGYTGTAFSRTDYLNTLSDELDSMEYMMFGQEDIYWKGETAYNKKDDSVNVYWTRNYNRAKYDSEMKVKHPELYASGSSSESGDKKNVGFGTAWATTISNRQTSYYTTQSLSNMNQGTASGLVAISDYMVNRNTATTGIAAVNGTRYIDLVAVQRYELNIDDVKA